MHGSRGAPLHGRPTAGPIIGLDVVQVWAAPLGGTNVPSWNCFSRSPFLAYQPFVNYHPPFASPLNGSSRVLLQAGTIINSLRFSGRRKLVLCLPLMDLNQSRKRASSVSGSLQRERPRQSVRPIGGKDCYGIWKQVAVVVVVVAGGFLSSSLLRNRRGRPRRAPFGDE